MKIIISVFLYLFVGILPDGNAQTDISVNNEQSILTLIYSELIFHDSDLDGVLDQNDKEPDTPFLTAVSAAGISLDSDQDGCLDNEDPEPYSDQEKIITNCVNIKLSLDSQLIAILNNIPHTRTYDDNWYLPIIFFVPDSYQVSPSEFQSLNLIVEVMTKYSDMIVYVSGTTSPYEKSTDPEKLAIARIRSVVIYLLNQGVSINQLVAQFNNLTVLIPDENKPNCRVELHIAKY